jgi:nucleoside-diphosphate-sugar epimerase
LPPAPTLVLHLAFLGRDKTDMPPERYREVNRAISRQVFETLEKLDAHSIFIPSTWAVSLAGQTEAQKIYGELKLEDEERFSRWAEATGCRAVIARVFNLSGPYINKQDVYALASFIKDALRDLPISIQANKPVFRSFVAIEELMSVVVGQLLLSRNGTVRFDAVGEETIELGDLAVQVQQALKRPPDVRRPPMLERQRATERVGDPEPYRKLRAETGVLPIGMKEQILSTASFIAEELGLEA